MTLQELDKQLTVLNDKCTELERYVLQGRPIDQSVISAFTSTYISLRESWEVLSRLGIGLMDTSERERRLEKQVEVLLEQNKVLMAEVRAIEKKTADKMELFQGQIDYLLGELERRGAT